MRRRDERRAWAIVKDARRLGVRTHAAVGPDLNKPYSPTEYFQASFLTKLIRDPASVRDWGQRTMPGFSPSVLSDEKVEDLLAYLRHMAEQRSRTPQR